MSFKTHQKNAKINIGGTPIQLFGNHAKLMRNWYLRENIVVNIVWCEEKKNFINLKSKQNLDDNILLQ